MVLETVVLNACSVVVGGDLNVHVQDDGDVNARRFNELIASFDMMQHVRGPTHRAGHTLDVVLTFSACQPQAVTVAPAGILSDHSLVTCRLLETVHASTSVERFVRGWRKVDRVKLRRLYLRTVICVAQRMRTMASISCLIRTSLFYEASLTSWPRRTPSDDV